MGAERRVERGIFETPAGWRIYVRHAGRLHAQRLPAKLSIGKVRQARADLGAELRRTVSRPAPRAPRATFAADVERYLKAVASMPTIKWRKKDLDLWIAEFGTRRRDTIATPDIDAVLHRWVLEGYAGNTVRHRRTALMHLWTRLDGRSAPNPVKDAFLPAAADAEPRGLPYGLVAAILRRMRPSKTRARLEVMAWTGLSHKQVAELVPAAIDYQARVVLVPRRWKGKTAPPFPKRLTDEGVAALRTFAAWEAWGTFSRDSMRASFRRACLKLCLHAGKGGLRPYDFKHSYGTKVYALTGDLTATMEALGQRDIRTTRRYALAAIPPRVDQAIEAFGEATKGLGTGRKVTRPVTAAREP